MPDGLDTLSKVSGIPRAEMNAIWQEVKANHTKLEACSRHQFEPLQPGQILTKYRCTACLGEVDAIAKSWYEKGLEHARA